MITIIAAVSKNGVIGNEGHVPWDIPEDRKYYLEKAEGKCWIVGRKTFEAHIKNKFIKDGSQHTHKGKVVVMTRDKSLDEVEDGVYVNNIAEAIEKCEGKEIAVLGGGTIYRLFIEKGLVDEIYLTEIDKEYEGDTFFPEFDKGEWDLVESEEKWSEKEECKYWFNKYVRK